MNKNIVFASFGLPIILAIFGAIKLSLNTDSGFGALASFLYLVIAFIWASVVGIALFFLRAKKLVWWHGLLVSLGSLIVAVIVFVLAFSF